MGEVKREGVRRFEMSVHPEPEVPYSVRPIPDEHGAFTYWGTWMDDHEEEIATLRAKLRIFLRRRDSECEEIDTLRAENERLLDEAYNARQSAKGENALRLGAEDDHAKEIASLRAQLEEACNFVVDSECSCLPYASPEHGGMCERCVWLGGRD